MSGIVQGVGYRYFAHRTASRLGLSGFTRNLRDGRVEVYAIGQGPSLTALRLELERGPAAASVEAVSEQEVPVQEEYLRGFSIEHDD